MQLAAVGVDLGGTKIAAALVDENGDMLQSLRVETDVDGGSFCSFAANQRACLKHRVWPRR